MARNRAHPLNLDITLILQLIIFPIFFLALPVKADSQSKPQGVSPIIGIDLGDTYTRVAITKDGRTEVFTDETGSHGIPSYIAFTQDGLLVGEAARIHTDRENVLFHFMKLLGRTYEEAKDSQDCSWPLRCVNESGMLMIEIKSSHTDGKLRFSPIELTEIILRKAKNVAEESLGEKVHEAVVAVPVWVYHDAKYKEAICEAGKRAGFEHIFARGSHAIAAVAHNPDPATDSGEQHILVFDVGGSSSDATVYMVEEGLFDMEGNVRSRHGGKALNAHILAKLAPKWQSEHDTESVEPDADIISREYIQGQWYKGADLSIEVDDKIEQAKRKLSTDTTADISMDGYNTTITRTELELYIKSAMKPTDMIDEVLAEANLTKADIDDYILVGGSSRIPLVRDMIAEYFEKPPCQSQSIEPDEAVVIGAAMLGTYYVSTPIEPLVFSPVEVVFRNLGVRTVDGFVPLLMADATLPATRTNEFTTAHDHQTKVTMEVSGEYHENDLCRNNQVVLHLDDIPPEPAGTTRIQIVATYHADLSGDLINITAIHVKSGKATSQILAASDVYPCAASMIETGGEIALARDGDSVETPELVQMEL